MQNAIPPTCRPTTDRSSAPQALTIATLAVTLVGAPSAALACGGGHGLFSSFDFVAFVVVPALVLGLGQAAARRFVSVRHASLPRTLTALLGLGLAAFGILVGLAIGFSAPVLGAPLVVVELAYLVDMLVMLVAPRRPPLVAI